VQSNSNEDLSSLSLEQLQEKAKAYVNDMTESDRKNRHRLIRVIQKNGSKSSRGKELDNIYFVLDVPKYELEERVRNRIEEMFKRGLLDENKKLLEMGYTYEDKGMKSIGYSEFKPYFEGLVSLEIVKEMIVKNTLSYIKRQKTWFRRNKNLYGMIAMKISQLSIKLIKVIITIFTLYRYRA
jgi:tRNA dimethylallyltransferase